MTPVLVLAGGPDAEHDVSISSGRAIAEALGKSGRFDAHLVEFEDLTLDRLRGLPGEVVFPALHGAFGEGGTLQRMLDEDGRPYVGSGARASRAAIDKVLTKAIATSLGLPVLPTAILDPQDTGLGLDLPVVVKPVFEGSTIGLHVCRTREDWLAAHASAVRTGKPTMLEPHRAGREVTVGLVDWGAGLEALPLIEIVPADGLYDYDAKYSRDDTRYEVDPDVGEGVAARLASWTLRLADAMGIRDLCRADFILDDQGGAVFLEVNTMPGFTGHSLVPMAAAARGRGMPELCAALVDAALERSRRDVGKAQERQGQGRKATG